MSPFVKINDEHSHLATPMQRYRARKRAKNLCWDCHEKAVEGKSRCQKHLEGNRKVDA